MIRRVELHNFTTHENTEVEFGNGKNIIIGATGSGKTNLLLAIDFALMGDAPNINLSELISDNADTAEVILDYLDPRTGQAYKINRTLTREAKGASHECTLINLETNEVVDKPAGVQKTLEALGVITSTYRNVVHVAQGGFASLLNETQEHKNSLDRLFQISQLENAYQELGRQEGPIRQIEQRKQNNLQSKKGFEPFASGLENEIGQLESLKIEQQIKREKLDDTVKEYNKLLEKSEQITITLKASQETERKLRDLDTLLNSCTSQIETSMLQLKRLLSQEEYNNIDKKTYSQTKAYLKTLESNLAGQKANEQFLQDNHREILVQETATESEIRHINEARKADLNQISSIEKYLQGKGEKPKIECDKCGSILTSEQWSKHLQEKRTLVKTHNEKILIFKAQLETEKKQVEDSEKGLNEISSKIRTLTNAILLVEQVSQKRQAFENISQTPLLEQKKIFMTEIKQLLQLDSTTTDQTAETQASFIQYKLSSLSKQGADLKKELQSYEDKYLKPQEERVLKANEAKKQIQKLEPIIAQDEKKIVLLQTIRSSLREIQPAIRRSLVSRISQSANDYLKRLYGDAEIQNFELTEDYEFNVTRAGHKKHASRLSGGQQVLASMAFLLALSEVLSQLDFIILDEPTTHLDENRRKELVSVLENLRRVPQLIIVDHHPELLEAADTRFKVFLTPAGLSQLIDIPRE